MLAQEFTICVQFPWCLELDNVFLFLFWRALSTASMAGSLSASEVIFISVGHSITLMGELT